MNKSRKWIAFIGAMALATIATSAAEKPQPKPATTPAKPAATPAKANVDSLFADPVIAKGKGFDIKRSQLDDAFIRFKANEAANQRTVPEAQRLPVERRLLDRLIITQILTNKATIADRAKAKDNAEKFVADTRKSAPNEESFQRQLKAVGVTLEEFQAWAFEQAIAEAVLDREVGAKVVVPDAEVKKYYDDHPKEFEQPEMARVAHVLIATLDLATRQELSDEQKKEKKVKAEKVLERARKGEDFAALVKEFSDDTVSKSRAGEYTFARGKDDPRRAMVPEFEAAAFSLKTNQISDIVTTPYGFHVIKLYERIPPRQWEFTKVSEEVREGMTREKIQRQLPDYFDKIKKDANAVVLEPSLALPPPKAASAATNAPAPALIGPVKPPKK